MLLEVHLEARVAAPAADLDHLVERPRIVEAERGNGRLGAVLVGDLGIERIGLGARRAVVVDARRGRRLVGGDGTWPRACGSGIERLALLARRRRCAVRAFAGWIVARGLAAAQSADDVLRARQVGGVGDAN